MEQIANGTFEVNLTPAAQDENSRQTGIGRMLIDKQFFGDLAGFSKGQMLTAMTAVEGSAGYVAIEHVTGTLAGQEGSFVLQHNGAMTNDASELSISVVPDSANGDLVGLRGTMTINIEDGQHFYEFKYTLSK